MVARMHMSRMAGVVAAAIALAPIASFATTEPRRTDIDIRSQSSADELQRCITREMAKGGRSTPVPIEGGVALDFYVWSLLNTPGESKLAIEIVDLGQERKLTASYRKPFSAKSAAQQFRIFTRNCLPAGAVEGLTATELPAPEKGPIDPPASSSPEQVSPTAARPLRSGQR